MARITCLGGSGFVGANLSWYFRARGHDITVVDNLVRRGSECNLSGFNALGIKFRHGDVRHIEDWGDIKADVVLHCAAQPSATAGYDNPLFDLSNNLLGTMTVLEYCRRTGAAMIYWSTNKTYSGDKINAIPYVEKPTRFEWADSSYPGINEDFPVDGPEHSIYGCTKLCGDLLCQEYHNAFGVKTVVNRFSCLAGERQWGMAAQGWVSWFVIAAELGLPVTFEGFGGKQVRDVLFVRDVCRLVEMEIEQIDKVAGQVFCAGGGNINTSLIECVSRIERITGKRIKTDIIDAPRRADHRIYISDISKARKILGWVPLTAMDDGIRGIVEWVRANKFQLLGMYGKS
jgi:CDP-paratose 2-epimerase